MLSKDALFPFRSFSSAFYPALKIARDGFEPPSQGPGPRMIDLYTTGLFYYIVFLIFLGYKSDIHLFVIAQYLVDEILNTKYEILNKS